MSEAFLVNSNLLGDLIVYVLDTLLNTFAKSFYSNQTEYSDKWGEDDIFQNRLSSVI